MTYRIRRALVWFAWGSDRLASWMAPRLRAGRRCFDCGAKLNADEFKYYKTTCERCEARKMKVWDDV